MASVGSALGAAAADAAVAASEGAAGMGLATATGGGAAGELVVTTRATGVATTTGTAATAGPTAGATEAAGAAVTARAITTVAAGAVVGATAVAVTWATDAAADVATGASNRPPNGLADGATEACAAAGRGVTANGPAPDCRDTSLDTTRAAGAAAVGGAVFEYRGERSPKSHPTGLSPRLDRPPEKMAPASRPRKPARGAAFGAAAAEGRAEAAAPDLAALLGPPIRLLTKM
mmetsp:Transcript_34398/g.111028  ORF Transcript_34398/g.111028 Transcript_34398/m.111028 type:complete len:233 (-) Transcript_34398:305-1003(-)